MLSKKLRLPIQLYFSVKGGSSFRGKKTGKILKSRYFLLKIFPTEFNYSRFGVVVSSRVSKKAVIRNRLKRIIFNFLKDKYKGLPISDYLFILYSSAASVKKEEIIDELRRILNLKS